MEGEFKDALSRIDPLLDGEIMRIDPGDLSREAACGLYVILKGLEKVVKSRVTAVKENLLDRIDGDERVSGENFWVTHSTQQRQPTLSFDKVHALVLKHRLALDKVFIVPSIEHRDVDLGYLEELVGQGKISEEELGDCYVGGGTVSQLRQGPRGELKKRLTEVAGRLKG
jgi:hypothetical protein